MSKKKSTTPKHDKKTTLQDDIASAEKKVDTTMDRVAGKVSNSVSAKTKANAKKAFDAADALADDVDAITDKIDHLADEFFPHSGGSEAHYDAQWSTEVSRLFVFRFLWLIVQYPVMAVWSLWISLLTIVQWIYMLLFGKREKNLWQRQIRFCNHVIKRQSYIIGITDQRPSIITAPIQVKTKAK